MRSDRLEHLFGANLEHTYNIMGAPSVPMEMTHRAMVTTKTTYIGRDEGHGSIRVDYEMAGGWAEQTHRETAKRASYVERAGIHAHKSVCVSEERRRFHHIKLIGPINRMRERL